MDNQILIITTSFLGVSLCLFFLMAVIIKNFAGYTKKVLLYAFLLIPAFALVALLSYKKIISDPNILLPVFQLCFFGLGMMHAWILSSYFDWDSKNFRLHDLLFSWFMLFLGLIPFICIYTTLNGIDGYQYLMPGASLFFMIPVLFRITFELALHIPPPEFKQWFYPIHTQVPDPKPGELENPYVISFIINKQSKDAKPTTFRAKAPAQIPVGRLFYYFLDDYNAKHAESPVEFTDKFGRPYGWLFYFKPKWYLFFLKRYIDADFTVRENGIGENSVIICERTETGSDSSFPALHEHLAT